MLIGDWDSTQYAGMTLVKWLAVQPVSLTGLNTGLKPTSDML